MVLTPDRYRAHITRESRLFRDVLAAADLHAPVPACPDWDAATLLTHLTHVQRFWSGVVNHRPAPPTDDDDEPTAASSYDRGELLAAFDVASAELQEALAAAQPSDPAWTWSTEQTVGFTMRMQAHEATVHRVDAEQAAGITPGPLDVEVAADGVRQVLEIFYGGKPAWGSFTPGDAVLEVRLYDAGTSVLVQTGRFAGTMPDGRVRDEADVTVLEPGTAEPGATVEGRAADVLLWLWKRRTADGLVVAGDPEVFEEVTALLAAPLT